MHASAKNCPTLSQIGIKQINHNNLNLPFRMQGNNLYCKGNQTSKCYEAWNIGKEQSAQGWLILMVVRTANPENSLEQVNQSTIFDATSNDGGSGLGCHAYVRDIELHMYAPSNT